jgi:hypothetical protein
MSPRQYLTASFEKNFISTCFCFIYFVVESKNRHSYAAQESELAEAAGGGELLVAPCHLTTVLVPGFRIRINLKRIRIQHFRLNTDPDPDLGIL